jgi:hypothetical protein
MALPLRARTLIAGRPRQEAADDQTGRERCFHCRLIGTAARRALFDPEKILAVFPRSFYIAGEADALACIGPLDLKAGPLNVLCDVRSGIDWPAWGLRPGVSVERIGDMLQIGAECTIGLGAAPVWRAPALPLGWCREELQDGLARLINAARVGSRSGGFSPLLPSLATGRIEADAACDNDPLLRLAGPGIAALGDFLDRSLAGHPVAPGVPAEILIGLGPGLTPSGDDFIGGILIALTALGRRDVAQRLSAWALPLAARRTGAISAAHLACAGDGEGNAALHEMLSILVTPGAPGLPEALAALSAIGHSSGLDAMAGAALTCALWLRTAPG